MVSLLSQITILLALSLPAFAQVPADCKNVALFERALQRAQINSDYLKACSEFVEDLADIQKKVQEGKIKSMVAAETVEGTGQADSLRNVANITAAGGATKHKLGDVASDAHTAYSTVAEESQGKIHSLNRDATRVLKMNFAQQDKEQFSQLAMDARKELENIRYAARSGAALAEKSAQEQYGKSVALRQYAGRQSEAADTLGSNASKAPGSGVSNDTLLLVGGGALIAGGVVGGLYYATKKSIDQADVAAQARIAQSEAAANRVIANAEASAGRMIILLKDSTNQIIADAAATATRLYERAKADLQNFIPDLVRELQGSFSALTDAQLVKLKLELESLLQTQIDRANREGNTALAAKLTTARDNAIAEIDKEIAKRAGGTSTSTATGTSSGTSTSSGTNTSTGTSSSTGTGTSSGTGTSTNSST